MSDEPYLATLQRVAELNAQRVQTLRRVVGTLASDRDVQNSLASWVVTYQGARHEVLNLRDRLIQAAGVRVQVPLERIKLPDGNRRHFKVLLLADSSVYTAYSPRDARSRNGFVENTWRGLDLIEGLWLTLANPAILSDKALDLVGTIYSLECTPTLYEWEGTRYLSAIAPDSRDEMCRPVFVRAAKQFRVGELDSAELIGRVRRFVEQQSRRTPLF